MGNQFMTVMNYESAFELRQELYKAIAEIDRARQAG